MTTARAATGGHALADQAESHCPADCATCKTVRDAWQAGFDARGPIVRPTPSKPKSLGETVLTMTGLIVWTVVGTRLIIFGLGLIANDGPAPS